MEAKIKSIKALVLDIDGVMTSGEMYYGGEGFEIRKFHIHDGLGVKLLQKSGIVVGVISGKRSEGLIRRLDELGIKHYYLGHEEKLPAYEKLKKTLQLDDHEIAYMGDDLPDIPLLMRVGFAITVPNASAIVKQHVDFITKNQPGCGAVREICEFILHTQGQYQNVIQSYLTQ